MALVKPYIEEEKWKENIRKYKFRGRDNSIFYNYIISPWCDDLVQYFPMSLAPNVVKIVLIITKITLIGLACNATIVVLTTYYTGLKGGTNIPSWVCHLSSLLYFSYMMLDNIDGKQARRTGSSSPLGMMFDHGCDVLTSFLLALGLGGIIYLDSAVSYTFIWYMIAFPFFLNTWEEYYTGELIFPLMHGVSEGTFIVCGAMHLSGFYGPEFWFYKVYFLGDRYLTIQQIAVTSGFLAGVGYGIYSIIQVLIKVQDRAIDALKKCFIFVYFVTSLLILDFLSDSTLVQNYPKLIILLYGFNFAKLLMHLQLAHITNSEFYPYRKSIISSLTIITVHTLMSYFFGITLINIDYILLGLLILHFIVWLHFVVCLSGEMCEILGIRRFTITPKSVTAK